MDIYFIQLYAKLIACLENERPIYS